MQIIIILVDSKLFTYVQGDANLYNADTELLFTPLVKSGDYNSEYIFTIDMSDTESYKLNTDYKNYISVQFLIIETLDKSLVETLELK